MRKYIIGIVVGSVLAFSGQAMAETISNVGKKIQSEYEVIVDGKTLPVKAVNVEGITLTPNRSLADATGYKVEFKNGVVVFTKKEGAYKLGIGGVIQQIEMLEFTRKLMLKETDKNPTEQNLGRLEVLNRLIEEKKSQKDELEAKQ